MKITVHESKKNEVSEYEQQAIDFCDRFGVTMKVGKSKYENPIWDDTPHYIFPVTFTRDGNSMTVRYAQSIKDGNTEPTAYDVLATIQKYDPGTFEDFCSEYGYDSDSKAHERIYKAVRKEWNDVDRVFGDCLDELQEIQ